MHPDYFSTGYAAVLEKKYNIPVVSVQHHHAHIVSAMAEHGLDEKVIGISMDGTGFGTDGNIWGGEFLVADTSDFTRFTHFDYIPMPGGDKAVEEPWRMAFSYLYKYFGDTFDYHSLPVFRLVDRQKLGSCKRDDSEEYKLPAIIRCRPAVRCCFSSAWDYARLLHLIQRHPCGLNLQLIHETDHVLSFSHRRICCVC